MCADARVLFAVLIAICSSFNSILHSATSTSCPAFALSASRASTCAAASALTSRAFSSWMCEMRAWFCASQPSVTSSNLVRCCWVWRSLSQRRSSSDFKKASRLAIVSKRSFTSRVSSCAAARLAVAEESSCDVCTKLCCSCAISSRDIARISVCRSAARSASISASCVCALRRSAVRMASCPCSGCISR